MGVDEEFARPLEFPRRGRILTKAVQLLLDIAMKDHPEPTVRRRAMAALFVAHVKDVEPPKVDAGALKPHVGRLLEVIRDGSQEGGNVNDAFALLAVLVFVVKS